MECEVRFGWVTYAGQISSESKGITMPFPRKDLESNLNFKVCKIFSQTNFLEYNFFPFSALAPDNLNGGVGLYAVVCINENCPAKEIFF